MDLINFTFMKNSVESESYILSQEFNRIFHKHKEYTNEGSTNWNFRPDTNVIKAYNDDGETISKVSFSLISVLYCMMFVEKRSLIIIGDTYDCHLNFHDIKKTYDSSNVVISNKTFIEYYQEILKMLQFYYVDIRIRYRINSEVIINDPYEFDSIVKRHEKIYVYITYFQNTNGKFYIV